MGATDRRPERTSLPYRASHRARLVRPLPHRGRLPHLRIPLVHEALHSLLSTHPVEDGLDHVEALFLYLLVDGVLRPCRLSRILS